MIMLSIDNETCIRCGRCVAVCPARILTQQEQKGDIGVVNLRTCIECSQCVSICPTDSVIHSLFPVVHRVRKELIPSPESLLELMKKRRSNRAFSQNPIPMAHLDMILEAANLAPTAKNDRPLEYTLITNPETLKALHGACIKVCDKLYEKLKDAKDDENRKKALYFRKLSNVYNNGYEIILRGATAVILIHANTSQAILDANLSYQNASLMAESLTIAHFYTGYLRILSSLDPDRIIREAVGIEGDIYAGMALAMPKYTFEKYTDKNDLKVNKLI